MPLRIPSSAQLVRSSLADFPRPDKVAESLLTDWLKARGVDLPPSDIDVVTLHYQYTRLASSPDRYTVTAVVSQRVNMVEAMLANWQGEPATGYAGTHVGDWAGIAPSEAAVLVKRLDPLSAVSNGAPYLIFNGLYRRTSDSEYSPTTQLDIRAEDFQSYLWGAHLHARVKRCWTRTGATAWRAIAAR
jgi:hypothetical protein